MEFQLDSNYDIQRVIKYSEKTCWGEKTYTYQQNETLAHLLDMIKTMWLQMSPHPSVYQNHKALLPHQITNFQQKW